jgi:hypothetical protein
VKCGGEKVRLYLKIGIIILFCLLVLFFSTSFSPNSWKENVKSSTLNASTTGTPVSFPENATSSSEGQFNSTINNSTEPAAITLEKPPFIK